MIYFFGAFSNVALPIGEPYCDCNYGDLAIYEAETKYLIKGKGVEYYALTPRNIEHLNKQIPSALIIGGGGIIHPIPSSKSGWLFSPTIEEIEKLKKQRTKIIIFAIGKNIDTASRKWDSVCKENFQFLLTQSDYICGRDRNTVNFLYQQGAKKADLCPDPALFLFQEKKMYRQNSDYFNVIWTPHISLNFLFEMVGRTGLKPKILIQNEIWKNDERLTEIKKYFPVQSILNVWDFLKNIQGANFAISSTLHGCILSIASEIPCLMYLKNERMQGFKDLFLENFDGFPCILSLSEKEYIGEFLKRDFSEAIKKRKETLFKQFNKNIEKVQKIIL